MVWEGLFVLFFYAYLNKSICVCDASVERSTFLGALLNACIYQNLLLHILQV